MKQCQSMLKASVAFLVLCFFLSSLALAADTSNDRIVFLTLKFDKSSVQLVDSKIVPGHLKTNRGPSRGEIQYELLGDSGLLLQGAITDPLVQRLEYEDPDNTGKILSKVIAWPEATITLRVPYSAAIKQLSFYRTEQTGGDDSKATRTTLSIIDLTIVHRGER